MARFFHEHGTLFQWNIAADPIDQGTKAFTRIVEAQGWTRFKPSVAREERGGDTPSHMRALANVDPNVQGLMRQLEHL
jgi:hypothetical protein